MCDILGKAVRLNVSVSANPWVMDKYDTLLYSVSPVDIDVKFPFICLTHTVSSTSIDKVPRPSYKS
jgi:hypothetical protein